MREVGKEIIAGSVEMKFGKPKGECCGCVAGVAGVEPEAKKVTSFTKFSDM